MLKKFLQTCSLLCSIYAGLSFLSPQLGHCVQTLKVGLTEDDGTRGDSIARVYRNSGASWEELKPSNITSGWAFRWEDGKDGYRPWEYMVQGRNGDTAKNIMVFESVDQSFPTQVAMLDYRGGQPTTDFNLLIQTTMGRNVYWNAQPNYQSSAAEERLVITVQGMETLSWGNSKYR